MEQSNEIPTIEENPEYVEPEYEVDFAYLVSEFNKLIYKMIYSTRPVPGVRKIKLNHTIIRYSVVSADEDINKFLNACLTIIILANLKDRNTRTSEYEEHRDTITLLGRRLYNRYGHLEEFRTIPGKIGYSII